METVKILMWSKDWEGAVPLKELMIKYRFLRKGPFLYGDLDEVEHRFEYLLPLVELSRRIGKFTLI